MSNKPGCDFFFIPCEQQTSLVTNFRNACQKLGQKSSEYKEELQPGTKGLEELQRQCKDDKYSMMMIWKSERHKPLNCTKWEARRADMRALGQALGCY